MAWDMLCRTTAATRLLAVTVALLLLMARPAAADPIDKTTGTIEITGGVLRIDAPGDAGSLGKRAYSARTGTVRGSLGQVTVTDERGAATGADWVASVVATPLTGPHGLNIPASTVGYATGPIRTRGTATVHAHNPPDISKNVAAVVATKISGDNSATWRPTLLIHIPGGTPAGIYSVTVTHSVL